MKILENIKLQIPHAIGRDFLVKLMGGRLNDKLEELLDQNRQICINSIYPKAVYSNYEIKEIVGYSVYFNSGNVFSGPNISKILRGSKSSTIFVTTLGSQVDKIIKEASDSGDTLATIIMDAITTEMLSFLGDYIGRIIKAEGAVKPGWSSTCTYSPGQYKWTIEEQKELFSMVDGSKIGVTLNSSFLMLPFKSISGVFGFGPAESINKTRVACDLCPRENCIGRR